MELAACGSGYRVAMEPPAKESKVPLTVALFQGEAVLGDLQANLEKMKRQMKEAKTMGADLIVFPELFTTGYRLSADQMKEKAESKGGQTFLELSACAREMDIAVLYGYPELEENSGSKAHYNSVQFIDKDGTPLQNYRKTHLWIDHYNTEAVFTPGEALGNVFEFRGVKIGLLICFDVEFPETVRSLALRGAELILVPTASLVEYNIRVISQVMVASRAFENGVYVAYVNHCGGTFGGLSRCCGPNGATLASAETEEGILMATVTEIKEASYYLTNRRPSLYKELVVIR